MAPICLAQKRGDNRRSHFVNFGPQFITSKTFGGEASFSRWSPVQMDFKIECFEIGPAGSAAVTDPNHLWQCWLCPAPQWVGSGLRTSQP